MGLIWEPWGTPNAIYKESNSAWFKHLTQINEYTRHGIVAEFCLLTCILGMLIKQWSFD